MIFLDINAMKDYLTILLLGLLFVTYGQNKSKENNPLITFELGTLFQTPIKYQKQFVPGGKLSVDPTTPNLTTYSTSNDVFESYESQYIFYKFNLRLYKGLAFSFRQAFTYDHVSIGVGDYYEPDIYYYVPDYIHVNDYKAWIFQNTYALNYNFRIKKIPVKVFYQFSRNLPIAPQRVFLFPSTSFADTDYYYDYRFEGPGIEFKYKKMLFGVSYTYDTSLSNPIPTFLLFSLSYQLKEWY